MSPINVWDAEQVSRAERVWGRKFPPYTREMFNFATTDAKSWLDLGCGFGRFLEFLLTKFDEPNYIAYDSSKDMVNRMNTKFPEFLGRVFVKDITSPITHNQESIVCSAVFIHLTEKEQLKVLKNLRDMTRKPKSIVFDINCYEMSRYAARSYFREEISKYNFRLTYQSPNETLKLLNSLFHDYSIKVKKYRMPKRVFKTVFLMTRDN